MDCLIVGGGIIGLLCARELNSIGWRVEVLDRGAIGCEASWAGGGILSPLYPWRQPGPIVQLALWSRKHYPELIKALIRDTGIDPEWQQCGMLWLDLEDIETACRFCQQHKIDWENISPKAVEKRWPGLKRFTGESLWIPEIGQIRNPRLLKALKHDLNRRGVPLKENTPVIGWRVRGDRIVSAMTTTGEIRADVFIVTAGAWASSWQMDGLWQPDIRPIKGQMLLIKALKGMLQQIVQRGEHYLIPRLDGRILVGSTVEEAGFDKRPTEAAYRVLHGFALETLPNLKAFPVELHWAGLRPKAPSGIPYIGRHPVLLNLYYNCGHFRNGVTMGPSAAGLLKDMLLGREPILDPGPYLPENRT
ncbi:MAG: glycine oxidase ThiO [Methylohalobius sp.]